ncbi:MAG: hypothetical protein WKF37_10350 [Bryobacteraceae bacterium]
MASLPLGEGYTTTFRNFDIQKQKPKLMQLKVAGLRGHRTGREIDAYKFTLLRGRGG